MWDSLRKSARLQIIRRDRLCVHVGLEHSLPAASRSLLLPLVLHLWRMFCVVIVFVCFFNAYFGCGKFQTEPGTMRQPRSPLR